MTTSCGKFNRDLKIFLQQRARTSIYIRHIC